MCRAPFCSFARVAVWFGFLIAVFVGVSGLRVAGQNTAASQDRWWSDYAGGPASARYLEANHINRSNVDQLDVAWTYPFGETGSNPIVVARRHLWSRPERLAARAGCENGDGDLDSRRHAGDDHPWHELLGEQGRQGSAPDLCHERLSAGDQRRDGAACLSVRHGTASSICAKGSAVTRRRSAASSPVRPVECSRT